MSDLASFIRGIPKAELHLHIEGSLEPEQMFAFGQRNKVAIPFKSVEEIRAAYAFSNLQDFLDIYYQGAEVLSLVNDDENKVFGITFKTPPEDSTGVAHILEHSVLCGSRKYPVKKPFVELLKGSQLDYVEEMVGSSFQVKNPNAKSSCGCGVSFSI